MEHAYEETGAISEQLRKISNRKMKMNGKVIVKFNRPSLKTYSMTGTLTLRTGQKLTNRKRSTIEQDQGDKSNHLTVMVTGIMAN